MPFPQRIAETPEPPTKRSPEWSLPRRLLFRFAFIYFVLYALPFPTTQILMPFTQLPWIDTTIYGWIGSVSQETDQAWKDLGVKVGHDVFGIEGEIFVGRTGSGDTTVDYIRVLLIFVASVVGCAIWSLVVWGFRAWLRDDREPPPALAKVLDWGSRISPPTLLCIGCRYYLGFYMLSYGYAKVIKTQFMEPSLTRLLQPVGDLSPMGMVWTFMGSSTPYTVFAGLGEAVGGLLLFFRRTRTLGALVVIGVMTNVVMLNYCYDVPVKLFSSHLLLFAIIIAGLDGRRLLNILLLNRATQHFVHKPYTTRRWLWWTLFAIKIVMIGTASYTGLHGAWQFYHSGGDGRTKSPLYGIHDVTSFRVDGEELPELVSSKERWDALIIDRPEGMFGGPGFVVVRWPDHGLQYYQVELDSDAGTLVLKGYGSEAAIGSFDFERPTETQLLLKGTYQDRDVEILMTERDLDAMNLNRGYHWINELPYNR